MGGGMDPRQMAMMMKRLGIDVKDISGVEDVVIRTADKEYTFSKPSVSVMKAQGVETWQVSGSAVAKPRPAGAGAGAPAAAVSAATGVPVTGKPGKTPGAVPGVATLAPGPAGAPAIPEEDIRMVMDATGASQEKARRALEATGGDIAEAIVQLGPK